MNFSHHFRHQGGPLYTTRPRSTSTFYQLQSRHVVITGPHKQTVQSYYDWKVPREWKEDDEVQWVKMSVLDFLQNIQQYGGIWVESKLNYEYTFAPDFEWNDQ